MNKYYYYIILANLIILLASCTSTKSVLKDYEDQAIVYSNTNNEYTKTIDFSFESDDENLLCLGFLDKFKEDVVVYLNDELVLTFNRNGSKSYKELSHAEVFKFISLENPNKENIITIGLVHTKKKMHFTIGNDERFFLLSRYNELWFVTEWNNDNGS